MRAALVGVTLVLALTGCTGDDPGPADPTSTPPATTTPDPTAEPDDPTEPTEPSLLDWAPVPGPVDDAVTVSGDWSLTLPRGGASVTLDGPDPQTLDAPAGFAFTEALVDGDFAVAVAEHRQSSEPNRVTVLDLAGGEIIDVDLPAATGGSYALGSGLLANTLADGPRYCVAVTDLLAGRSRTGPCVPPRHGVSNLTVSPGGIGAMTFDDGRPSCRTLNRVAGSRFAPLAGVEECTGWEAIVTETFALWGEVLAERRIEASEYVIDTGAGPVEIGPGTSGTLTWCGDAAYVVRDPQRRSDPARLLRIATDGSADVVYESAGTGRAFLSAPRCGGTDLTVTSYSARGDEQVTTSLR